MTTSTYVRVQDYGNKYESTAEVLAALQGNDVEKLLKPSESLFGTHLAKIL